MPSISSYNIGGIDMLLKPKWARMIPANLRPDSIRIKQLENLRTQYEIPHEQMAMRVAQSKTTTRKVQRDALEYFRRHSPDSSEKELLKMVLISRLNISQMTNPYNLSIYDMSEDAIDEAMEKINSFDELMTHIYNLDEQEPILPDPIGLGKKIDDILEQEVIQIKQGSVKRHRLLPKTELGPDSSLKRFPLLYLYFDTFSEIRDAWEARRFEAARHDADPRSAQFSLKDIMHNELLFLTLYENGLVRLKLDDGTELRRDSEEEYWNRAVHPEEFLDKPLVTNRELTDETRRSLLAYINKLDEKIGVTVNAIKLRYGI
jgi:hypothetical protein